MLNMLNVAGLPFIVKMCCGIIITYPIPCAIVVSLYKKWLTLLFQAFSAHPDFCDQLLIEAGLGLGEAIVSGRITPDRFVIDKNKEIILIKKISKQSKALTQDGWIQLSEECRPIIKSRTNKTNKNISINSSYYDFLWQTDFSLFFCSIYLESGYLEGNFISYHSSSKHTLFVAKEYKKILGLRALSFYCDAFKDYKKAIIKNLAHYKVLFPSLFHKKLNELSNQKIADYFEKLIHFCITILKDYFITESHSTGGISALIQTKKGKVWKKNIAHMAKLKFSQRRYLNKMMYEPSIFHPYLREIERRLNPPQNVQSYTWKELLNGLRKNKLQPNLDRMNSSIQGQFSNWEFIYGVQAELYYQQLMDINHHKTILTGDIGNSGWYMGRIIVIHHVGRNNIDELINNMEKGSVLVSGSTGPELMLACKKASAIITDEGEIISHAVLISRELGIPSIIGTQYATQLLKDGDWVEVDANIGIVKILKS